MLTIGIERVVPEGATGDYHTDLKVKARTAYDLLYKQGYEFCFLHIKGYDEAGHDKLICERTKMAQQTDEMLGLFMDLAKQESDDCIISITGDHSTPMYYGDHTFEPVQVTISTKDAFFNSKTFFLKDDCQVFNEVEAGKGILGRFSGSELMSKIFKLRDRINEKGIE